MQPSILPATEAERSIIAHIGRISVEEAHQHSCSAEDMQTFFSATYNEVAIGAELADKANIYHLLYAGGRQAGFSKIIFSASHPSLPEQNVTKLDRIYLLTEFYGTGLGHELLQFNVKLSRQQQQSRMWLFTWKGNTRAVRFYQKCGFEIIASHRFKVTETHYNEHHHMLLRY